jgi:hypothetical protein
MAEENPEANLRSRAIVGSRIAGLPLDGGGSVGNPGLSADAVTHLLYVSCTCPRADGSSIFCTEGADSRLGSIADRCNTSRDSCSVSVFLAERERFMLECKRKMQSRQQ